jgi:hypothetical protein
MKKGVNYEAAKNALEEGLQLLTFEKNTSR